jgi:hypothetical protein
VFFEKEEMVGPKMVVLVLKVVVVLMVVVVSMVVGTWVQVLEKWMN